MIWIVILLENEFQAQKVPSRGSGTLLCRVPPCDTLFRLYWLKQQLGFPRNMSKPSLASSMFNCWHHTAKEKALPWTTIPVDVSQKLQISIPQSKGTSSIVPQSKVFVPQKSVMLASSHTEVCLYEQLLFLKDQFLFSKHFDWFLAFVLEPLTRT